nr:MAG TPA: hypothetical protein [Caudoviricetes sp.]DAH97207.1 MAG TPA: hypothetical protein [Bacteriophage sp.]
MQLLDHHLLLVRLCLQRLHHIHKTLCYRIDIYQQNLYDYYTLLLATIYQPFQYLHLILFLGMFF